MPSKKKDDALVTYGLDVDNPCSSGHMGSDHEEKDNMFRDQHSPEERAEVPWEKRYEKLWVEVEKREVKSTFKNVAGELKEKFGEKVKSGCTAEDVTEEEQATAESSSAEEDSSDEEEGEVIIRPTARARSTVLLTIPEQRESGLEDSESTDNSLHKDGMQVCELPAREQESTLCPEPVPVADDILEESRSPSYQFTMAKRDSNINPVITVFTDNHSVAMSDVDQSSFTKDESKHQLDLETEKNFVHSEEDPEESKSCSLSRRSAFIPGVSNEELEEGVKRFKTEVGILKPLPLDLEKEKAQLHKEVEDGRPVFQ